jgi:hypothetical protein
MLDHDFNVLRTDVVLVTDDGSVGLYGFDRRPKIRIGRIRIRYPGRRAAAGDSGLDGGEIGP